MLRKLAVISLGMCLNLLAEVPKQSVQVTTTNSSPFTAGGAIRIDNSWGQLNVESWDRPEVELTVTRSTFARDTAKDRDAAKRGLDAIHVTMDRSSKGELV